MTARRATFLTLIALATGTALAGVGVLVYATADANLWPMSPDMWWTALLAVGVAASLVPGLMTPRRVRVRLRIGSPPTTPRSAG